MAEPTVRDQRSWLALFAGVAVAGGCGWVVDTALLWFLDTRVGVPTAIAAAIGFFAAGVVNFLLNRIVFHARGATSRQQTTRYAALFAANLAVVSALVPLLSHLFHGTISNDSLRLIGSKLLTTAALLPLNTFAYHRWVFVPSGPVAGVDPAA